MVKKSPNNNANDRPLDFSNHELWLWLQEQKAKADHDRNRHIESSNQTERALCGQLMLITTVLLTGNVVLFSNKDTYTSLTNLQSYLLIAGIVFLCLSITAGIKHYFEVMNFFTLWAKTEDSRADIYNNQDFETWTEAGALLTAVDADAPKSTNNKWLLAQLISLGSAVALYLLLVSGVLFD
jgi:hypothetical protein